MDLTLFILIALLLLTFFLRIRKRIRQGKSYSRKVKGPEGTNAATRQRGVPPFKAREILREDDRPEDSHRG